MKRILSIFVYALAIAFNSIAQEKTKVVVNGLQVCDMYTRAQMYEALGGVPTKIEEVIEDPGSFSFYYGKDMFYWRYEGLDAYKDGIDHHCFDGCHIYTDRYVVFDSIRVGDPISKLSALHGETEDMPELGCVEWYPSKAERNRDGMDVRFYYNETSRTISRIEIFVYFL